MLKGGDSCVRRVPLAEDMGMTSGRPRLEASMEMHKWHENKYTGDDEPAAVGL